MTGYVLLIFLTVKLPVAEIMKNGRQYGEEHKCAESLGRNAPQATKYEKPSTDELKVG